jgi:hypothetical protein
MQYNVSQVIKTSGPAYGMTKEEHDAKFGRRIAQLEETRRKLERQIEALTPDAVAGKHFKVLMRAINENPMLTKQWEQMMMTMRLCGLDNSTSDSQSE